MKQVQVFLIFFSDDQVFTRLSQDKGIGALVGSQGSIRPDWGPAMILPERFQEQQGPAPAPLQAAWMQEQVQAVWAPEPRQAAWIWEAER